MISNLTNWLFLCGFPVEKANNFRKCLSSYPMRTLLISFWYILGVKQVWKNCVEQLGGNFLLNLGETIGWKAVLKNCVE